MAGFFLNTLANFRMTLCAKEVASKLKIATEEQCCRVALMAALLKRQMMNERVPGGIATSREIAEHPKKVAREQCYTAYCLLEDVRELSRQRIRAHISNGTPPPPEILEHMEISDLALSLWMATIGVGCTTSGLKSVSFSWNLVASLPVAWCDIQRIMDTLAYYGESALEPFAALGTDEWIALARKIPEFLTEQQQ